MFSYSKDVTPAQRAKLDGLMALEKGDVFYVVGMVVNVGEIPDGALPLKSKPVGKYQVIDGKWVDVK